MPGIAPTKRNASTTEPATVKTPDRNIPDVTVTERQQTQSTQFRMDRIAARAHEIYEARGGEHGHALDDWLQAEREIDAEMQAERAVKAPRPNGL